MVNRWLNSYKKAIAVICCYISEFEFKLNVNAFYKYLNQALNIKKQI